MTSVEEPGPHDLVALDLVATAALVATGTISPVELTHAYLERIQSTEAALNAFVTVDEVGALAQAVAAEKELAAGRSRGPLHGIPVGIKDLIDTAGLRTTYGSRQYADHVPTKDATIVARIRKSGAVILGKQATHEFAWGGRTDSPHFGPTHNPYDLDRIAGGSSGGGAASLVAHSSLLAIGTDTAGSVRIPAALSGCVGLKPTHGWIDLRGIHPLAPSLDHVGIMARNVADVAFVWPALSAASPARHRKPSELTIGWLRGTAEQLLYPDVALAVRTTVDQYADQGATIVELPLPDLTRTMLACLTLVRAEAEVIHHAAFARCPEDYGPDLAALLGMGPVGQEELRAARTDIGCAVAWLDAAMEQVDVVLSATVGGTAPSIGTTVFEFAGVEHPVEFILTRLTSIANAAGRPAISVPRGDSDGLPIGVQLIGQLGGESDLLTAATLCERAIGPASKI